MPRNEDGEFELVLGNRQLLSGFFIVVVLFGVFFTMGYIVGRHSPAADMAQAVPPDRPPAPVSETAKPARPPSDLAPGQVEVVSAAKPPVKTEAAKEAGSPVTAAPAAEPPKAEPPKPPPAPPSGVSEPAPGEIYLQVSAPAPDAAGGVLDALRAKGLPARVAPGPNEATVRVLVGPLQPDAIREMRETLEGAGFKPFVRKY